MLQLKKLSPLPLPTLFMALMVLPPVDKAQWHQFKYSSLPVNRVQFAKDNISIEVVESSSPLIYVLPQTTATKEIQVVAEVPAPFPPMPKNCTQGVRSCDDFILRVGLIVSGSGRLSWIQRLFAPDWVIAMEKLLPENQGVGQVFFISTCRDPKIYQKQRSHFLNSMLKEECVNLLSEHGEFFLGKTFAKPMNVIGLWVSADGDNTKERFKVTLKKIKLL